MRLTVPSQDARSLVKSTFPGRDSLIDRVYRENKVFRDLCQDFRNCTLALERWRRLSGEEPSQRAREYAELLAELAKELESWLVGVQNGAAPQPPGGAR